MGTRISLAQYIIAFAFIAVTIAAFAMGLSTGDAPLNVGDGYYWDRVIPSPTPTP